ncbi:hypothetical protein A9P82_04125 [Arachidicoccus ginsenosidimutans]|nr:hypothetical protein A9P82_04125 [Arachidicoccus sp. BS20]
MSWAYVPSQNLLLSGMDTTGTTFGKPGYGHIFFAVLSIVFFAIPKLWSKRANIFVAAMNLAWAVRNFILMSTCMAGDCPERRAGIYLVLASSVLLMIMTFLPKIELKEE